MFTYNRFLGFEIDDCKKFIIFSHKLTAETGSRALKAQQKAPTSTYSSGNRCLPATQPSTTAIYSKLIQFHPQGSLLNLKSTYKIASANIWRKRQDTPTIAYKIGAKLSAHGIHERKYPQTSNPTNSFPGQKRTLCPQGIKIPAKLHYHNLTGVLLIDSKQINYSISYSIHLRVCLKPTAW